MTRTLRAWLVAGLILFAPQSLRAEWSADFLPPEGPQGELRIELPDDLDFFTLTTLTVELDGQDITAEVTSDGGDFVYFPPAPLAEGEHVLRLLVLEGDGTLTEQQSWSFTIASAAGGAEETPATDPGAGPAADPAQASLIAPAGDFYDQQGPLVIAIPADLPSVDYATLRIELDQIDMTDLVGVEDGIYSLTPPEPLAEGLHSLSVVAFSTDGGFLGLGSWIFNAAAPGPAVAPGGGGAGEAEASGLPPVDIQSNNSLEAIARLLEGNATGDTKTFGLSGAGRTNLSSASGRWRMSAGGNYFLESQRAITQTDEVFDIGEYEARLDYDGGGWGAGVTAGHQNPGYDSFILSNFHRRGLSLSGEAGDGLIAAQGFALGAASQLGAEDPLGLHDESGEVLGGAVTLAPFDLGEDSLSFTGIFYDGEEGVDGFGQVNNQQDRATGSGWSLGFDSLWFERRLRVSGEVAGTDFDADGKGALVGEESSEAYALTGAYDLVAGEVVGGDYMSMTLSGGWEQVGSLFGSVANPGVAVDRDSLFAGLDLTWGGFYGAFRLREDENNVDGLAGLPTDRTRSAAFDGQYNFTIEREDPEDRAWLGTPYILFGGLLAEADRQKTPALYVGPGTDNMTTSGYLGFGSSYDTWGWQLTQQINDFDDKVSTQTDYRGALTAASVQWYPSDRFSLSLGSQFARNENPDLGTTSYDLNGLVGVDAVLIPETLDLSASYNLNLRTGSGDTPDRHLLSGEIGWTLRPAEANQIGIELALRGSMEWNEGSSNDDDVYEAFSVLRFTAPLSN